MTVERALQLAEACDRSVAALTANDATEIALARATLACCAKEFGDYAFAHTLEEV